jgi:LDH2 family malate/lactate/ureidoglycolate dehydrogenase
VTGSPPIGDCIVGAGALRAFAADVLRALGAETGTAMKVSESLVDADLRGIDSHGVHLLDLYCTRIGKGQLDPRGVTRIVDDRGSVVHLDGGLGFGQPCGVRAIDLGAERAREHGIASVLARETTHLGALGYYTRRAAEAGCVALAFQNGPTIVPPFGSTTPLFSTNPFSYAFPAQEEPPIVFDIATTAVAGNKLLLAKKRGDRTIPEGWANDERGRPTTDTELASVHQLQWFGGHKGFGIGFLVELMAGVATGSSFGRTEDTASPALGSDRVAKGFQFVVIDAERFMPAAELRARVDTLIRDVHASALGDGVDHVYVPGEIEYRTRERRLAEGIPLARGVVDVLDAIASDVGVLPLLDGSRMAKDPA